MGIFSKNRSTSRTHDTTTAKSNNGVDKKRWKSSVRAYLCGDELFSSVLAEEDSASVKSSEATVTQPVVLEQEEDHSANRADDNLQRQGARNSEQDHDNWGRKVQLDEDTAATMIQSAFRGFMVRRLRMSDSVVGFANSSLKGTESPSRESLSTSIEVQTGNSVDVFSIQEGAPLSVPNKLQHKTKTPVFKQKEDWDDSTVDSSVSKMRTQHRIEAMTRRERALAYAFSQQLRVCSKKKHAKSDGTEPNMGWSWLERWMATRQPEASSVEDIMSKQGNELATSMKASAMIMKNKFLDLSFEEKESCGSNEVPVQVKSSQTTETETKKGCKTSKNRLKATKPISRRKTVPDYQYQKEQAKINSKGEKSKEVAKDKRQKVKQLGSKKETVSKDSASLGLSPDHSLSCQNSKSDP